MRRFRTDRSRFGTLVMTMVLALGLTAPTGQAVAQRLSSPDTEAAIDDLEARTGETRLDCHVSQNGKWLICRDIASNVCKAAGWVPQSDGSCGKPL